MVIAWQLSSFDSVPALHSTGVSLAISRRAGSPRFEGGFSFQSTGFMLNDNGPTHVDSFSHLDPEPSAQTIEQMPLELFYGTAVCLDVTGFPTRAVALVG